MHLQGARGRTDCGKHQHRCLTLFTQMQCPRPQSWEGVGCERIKESMDQNSEKESNAHNLYKIWNLTELKGKKWMVT